MIRSILLISFYLFAFAGYAEVIEVYKFDSNQKKQLFKSLTAELRCPKCQNQSIADSNSIIAQDLRNEVFKLIQQNHKEDHIINYMRERYGDFVLYKPRLTSQTIILWLAPVILLLGAIGLLFFLIKKHRKKEDDTGLNEQDKLELNKLLGKKK